MKGVLFVLSVLVAVVCVHCDPSEGRKQGGRYIEECKSEMEVTDIHSMNEQQKGCMMACLMKKKGTIGEDGKIIKDKAMEKYMKHHSEGADQEKVMECMDKANEMNDSCETAGMYMKCLLTLRKGSKNKGDEKAERSISNPEI